MKLKSRLIEIFGVGLLVALASADAFAQRANVPGAPARRRALDGEQCYGNAAVWQYRRQPGRRVRRIGEDLVAGT